MAATFLLCFSDNPSHEAPIFHMAMVSCFTFFLSLTIFILIFTLYTVLKNNSISRKDQNPIKIQSLSVNGDENPIKIQSLSVNGDENPIRIQSLSVNGGEDTAQMQKEESFFGPGLDTGDVMLLEILPSSNSGKWDAFFGERKDLDDGKNGLGEGEKKRKKKRAKKTRPGPVEEVVGEKEKGEGKGSLYPFTKSCGSTQRKIKQQYDQLLKSHGSKGLTLDQIGQFVNCLVEARNELQSRSEVIKRRFTITKALLFKADRSSFDRLRQQIYKVELEQKRLEEDAVVYNWLQEQLKASPAYKRMLEVGACMETKANSTALVESTDADYSDISFEELLAQEKKDAFWQRNGRLRTCTG